jgi:hypothetical protein
MDTDQQHSDLAHRISVAPHTIGPDRNWGYVVMCLTCGWRAGAYATEESAHESGEAHQKERAGTSD